VKQDAADKVTSVETDAKGKIDAAKAQEENVKTEAKTEVTKVEKVAAEKVSTVQTEAKAEIAKAEGSVKTDVAGKLQSALASIQPVAS